VTAVRSWSPATGDGGGDFGDWGDFEDYGGDGGGGDPPPTEPEAEEIVVTAPRPTQTCPVNDWWPNMFEDWGNVEALTPPVGPLTQWSRDQGTWCFYDDNDVLQAKFVDDPNGKETFTFNNANGQPSFNAGAAGVSGGYASNDSTSISIAFHVTRVYE
jgi:hypothetical protein